jgi:hypothetical protein
VLREVWSTQFDHVYVDESLLGGMRRARAAGMDELLMFLNAAVTGNLDATVAAPKSGDDASAAAVGDGTEGSDALTVPAERPKKFTVPTPFNLTQPRTAPVPEPEAIPNFIKPVPAPDISKQDSLEQIEAKKAARKEEWRQHAERKFKEAAAPELRSMQRPQHLPAAIEAAEAQLREQMRPVSPAKVHIRVQMTMSEAGVQSMVTK